MVLRLDIFITTPCGHKSLGKKDVELDNIYNVASKMFFFQIGCDRDKDFSAWMRPATRSVAAAIASTTDKSSTPLAKVCTGGIIRANCIDVSISD